MIAFDIETEALPLDVIQSICKPFDPSSVKHPGDFDPSSVKLGNLKDEKKIADKIAAEKEKHADKIKKFISDRESGEMHHWRKVQDSSALSAVTGAVCAIGYRSEKGSQLHLAIDGVDERILLKKFWKIYLDAKANKRSLVGWNIFQFDIPFIVQRSFIYEIEVPAEAFTPAGRPAQTFVDLMAIWAAGARGSNQYAAIDTVAKACGMPGKPDDCQGKEFAQKLRGDEADRQTAIGYLQSDIDMVFELAERFGLG